MWQRPRVEEKIQVKVDKGPNSLVDWYKKPVIIRVKCQIIEKADNASKTNIQMKNWERT